ncbi:unnamed protein product [Ranitomeya imitator]|uniref:Peptidase M20 dimerisation domain-containing protein n=1 Tax=Ranitomeya imitator TaxID=111125 RepID=A0ABN9KTF8_9NEOB|nr:unnamed protein product [Ranitomeya imitator]
MAGAAALTIFRLPALTGERRPALKHSTAVTSPLYFTAGAQSVLEAEGEGHDQTPGIYGSILQAIGCHHNQLVLQYHVSEGQWELITVLGTPAEEDGGGKVDLIKAGAFEDMDVVFMAHPAQDDAAYLPDVAVHDVTVKYYGKASHAAAYPWEGINALDAAILAYNNISVLRQQMKPSWRVHGIIKNGGVKPNIIPSYTELEFYLRAPSRKDLAELLERASACFHAAATATGCKVELCSPSHDYYNVLPNKALAKAYIENGKELGMKFTNDDLVLNALSGKIWECINFQ